MAVESLLVLLRYCQQTFLLWFGAIFAAVGLILLAVMAREMTRAGRSKDGYYRATAAATGKRVFHGTGAGDTYYIDFQYTDRNGRPHQGSANESKSAYDQSATGQPLAVYVSLQDSNDVWPVGDADPGVTKLLLAGLGSVLFIPGALLFGIYFRRCLKSVAALKHGTYIVGRVDKIVQTNEQTNGRSLYRVAWSWVGLDGVVRTGISPALGEDYARHWKHDDEIAAYIHPSDPAFAEADVFGFRSR